MGNRIRPPFYSFEVSATNPYKPAAKLDGGARIGRHASSANDSAGCPLFSDQGRLNEGPVRERYRERNKASIAREVGEEHIFPLFMQNLILGSADLFEKGLQVLKLRL